MKQFLLSFLAIGGFVSLSYGQLYDHTATPSGSGVISTYMTDNDTLVQCADDFVIPTGGNWDVTSVTVRGFRNGTGPTMDSMTVYIYDDASGLPGTTLYNETIMLGAGGVPVPQGDTAITITIPTQAMTAGTYWVSVYGYAPSDSRWNWLGSTASQDGNGALIDTDNFFGAGATSWTDVSTLVTDPDFTFMIGGTGTQASINESEMIELSVYPNPVIDVMQINTAEKVTQVNIFSVNGQKVNTIVNPQGNKVDVSDLPSGTYVVEVMTANGIGQARFVK